VGAAGAVAAELDTQATLGSSAAVPSTVNVGANSFDIKVWATGNISQSGDATVTDVYNMDPSGAITKSSAAGDQQALHFTPGYNYSQCPTTGAPAGCAGHPFIVHATLNIALGTPGGTTGMLTVSDSGSNGLSADPSAAQGYVKVFAPAVNNRPGDPGAPNASSNLSNDGVFTVNWGASTDPDAGDVVTYKLEQQNHDGSGWHSVASGLTGTSYAFGSGGNPAESEGTWSYRVTATDNHGASSNPAESDDLVKVDQSAPVAPSPNAPSAAYTDGSGNNWHPGQRHGWLH
jgi:hypothetical protein